VTDPLRLNRLVRGMIAEDIRRSESRFGTGIVAIVEGGYAAVRKGDPEAEATPGFMVSPELSVAEGDHVWYFDDGGTKMVRAVLNRNAVIPDDLTLVNLTLTGRLVRPSVR
jgi:hypothetical protein